MLCMESLSTFDPEHLAHLRFFKGFINKVIESTVNQNRCLAACEVNLIWYFILKFKKYKHILDFSCN